MDKQTEIMWEAEFLKQYPLQEETGDQLCFRVQANIAVHDALLAGGNWRFKHLEYCDPMYLFSSKNPYDTKARQEWYRECKQRFQAIFSAQPVYALEELRKGNLLIEENVHVT